MKINEVLDNVTLKLPGGGNLPLKKYSPYITNGEDNAEGITTEFIDKVISTNMKRVPDMYVLDGYFENEHDMWAYRYMQEYGAGNGWDYYNYDPKVISIEELKEYITLYCNVWGDYDWGVSIELIPLYKDNNIEDESIITETTIWGKGNIEMYYTNYPELLSTEYMESNYWDQDKIDFYTNLANNGLYSYQEGSMHYSNPEIPEDILQDLQNEYGVQQPLA